MFFVSANLEIGDVSDSIQTVYGAGSTINGWINLSVEDEEANNIFQDSFENEISLINLLKLNNDVDYSCAPKTCEEGYTGVNPETTKMVILNPGEKAMFGVRFKENIEEIQSIEFLIESNASASCYNQIEVDFFGDDEKINAGNSKSVDVTCDTQKSYGCFNASTSTENLILGTTPYCQRIEFSASSAFNIGAWIKKTVNGTNGVEVVLKDLYGDEIENGNCIISNSQISSTGAEISCNINQYLPKPKEFYVCLQKETGTAEYQIKGYASSNSCGFNSLDLSSENAAYHIFMVGKIFDAVGVLNISNQLLNDKQINIIAKDYLLKNYGTLDCSTEDGCVFPFEIISNTKQKIILKEAKISYKSTLGEKQDNKIYDLETSGAKVNTNGFQKIYLDEAEFVVPEDKGEYSFELEFNGEQIIEKTITIEDVPEIESISPRVTFTSYPTMFEIIANSPNNETISLYSWDFGDGTIKTTTQNKVEHSYNETGTYELNIKIKDSNERIAEKTFFIKVDSPEVIIGKELSELKKNINNAKIRINNYSYFIQTELKKQLNIDDLSSILESLERENRSATTLEEKNTLLKKILALKVPEEIFTSANLMGAEFIPLEKEINLDALQEITGSEYDVSNKNGYIKGIIYWQQENMDVTLSYQEISAVFNGINKPVLKIFSLVIKEKEALSSAPYLIVKNMENISFADNYGQRKNEEYYSVSLSNPENSFMFATTDKTIDFNNLPLFVSLSLDRVPVVEDFSGPISEIGLDMSWGLFILVLIFIIILGLTAYIFVQEWYKNKYETYLFKGRNNLYNLISFIDSQKKQGLTNEEIEVKLKKAGWNNEQRIYAIRKYEGKRTGMFEIPVEKIMNYFKKLNLNALFKKNNSPQTKQIQQAPKQFQNTSEINKKQGNNLFRK
jgi:PKD repeat protein